VRSTFARWNNRLISFSGVSAGFSESPAAVQPECLRPATEHSQLSCVTLVFRRRTHEAFSPADGDSVTYPAG